MKRLTTLTVMFAGALVAGAGAAGASQTAHYHGLILRGGSGAALSEIDTTTTGNNLFQKINNDDRGDRMHVQAPYRDRAPLNGNSVYVRVDWSKNGTYCYASGIGVSANGGSASVSCASGWNGAGQSKSKHVEDSGWWFFKADHPYDQLSNSLRAGVMTCEDHAFAPDPCSGIRYGGISY